MNQTKKYGKGIGMKLSCWIGNKFYMVPAGIMAVIALISMTANGSLVSWYNQAMSTMISSGFRWDLFKILIIVDIGCLFANRLNVVSMKTLGTKMINKNFVDIYNKGTDSKVSDINEITTGKLTDTSRTISVLKWDIMSYTFNIIPCTIPFISLIWKEIHYNWVCCIITVVGVIISALVLTFNEKLFGWTKEAKAVKAELQSVTVDNFMNMPTFKYIHATAYPLKRLLDAQKKAFTYELNFMKVMIYGLSYIAVWSPALINVWICRNNTEMVAYLLLTDYILQNMSNQITAVIDGVIELKSSEKVLEPLKGDDINSEEIFEGVMELDGTEFKYSEDVEETRYQEEGKKETIFKIQNVTLEAGKSYLVKGVTGSGKSSFATWLAGGLKTVKGYDKKYKTFYVWQETSMFNDTIINNILPGEADNGEKVSLVNAFANSLDMAKMLSELPEGWNTYAGERGYKLSSGQKQRINLIRALVNMVYHPEYIFILDEITSNLDDETRELAIKLIFETCKSTLIVVSHNPGFEEYINERITVSSDHVITGGKDEK